MKRLVTLVALCLLSGGCLRERFRRDDRVPATLPDRAPPAAKPMAQPKPPQPPPLRTDPVPPQPPTLPEVAPLTVSTPAESTAPSPTPTPNAEATPAPATSGGDVAAARALAAAGRRRAEEIPSLECRLTKREVVNGTQLPQDELVYRLRSRPFSVYMKVLSDAGKGRELLYVAGQNAGKIAVLTGKGDSVLVSTGFRTDLDPDSRQARSKSRHRITEAGFQRSLAALETAVTAAESGRAGGVKALGLVNRQESEYALEGVEVTLAPGTDPLLPRGGTRRVYFDAKPDSPGYRLPVLIETIDSAGQQVEYYFFHDIVVPCPAPASAWEPAKLGK